MNDCVVCETASPGLHAGVACCRACVAFFRRTKQLNLKYICRFDSKCNVSNKSRYSCRYCRYQKCIKSGLKFKGEVITKSEVRNSTVQEGITSKPTIPLETLSALVGIYGDETLSHKERQEVLKNRLHSLFEKSRKVPNSSIPLSQIQQGLLALEEYEKHSPVVHPIIERRNMDFVPHIAQTYQFMEYTGEFCMQLKDFAELPIDDKWHLYKNFWERFEILERLWVACVHLGYDPTDERYLLHDGTCVKLNSDWQGLDNLTEYKSEDIKKLMKSTLHYFQFRVIGPFKRFRFDVFEVVFMMLTLLWDVKDDSNCASTTIETSKRIKEQLTDELHNYYVFEKKTPNYAERIYKLVKIITTIEHYEDIRKEDDQLMTTFGIFAEELAMKDFRK